MQTKPKKRGGLLHTPMPPLPASPRLPRQQTRPTAGGVMLNDLITALGLVALFTAALSDLFREVR